MKKKYCVVLTTASRGSPARKLSQSILKSRLAACVNILPDLSSQYWWKGKIESCKESLLLIKTETGQLPSLIKFIQKIHPYEIPEILAVPVLKGNSSYLSWLSHEIRLSKK